MPSPIEPITLYSDRPDATRALGRRIGAAVEPGQVIALRGDLGAGKTTLAQGIAEGLGIAARVTSPTFTLVAEYQSEHGLRLVHVDAYRLGDDPADAAREAATFGLEEILAGVRANGYAFNDQELEMGLRSLAVPVRNVVGEVVAAMNVSVQASRVTRREMVDAFLPVLVSAARKLGNQLAPAR